jgi:hypothetical protein
MFLWSLAKSMHYSLFNKLTLSQFLNKFLFLTVPGTRYHRVLKSLPLYVILRKLNPVRNLVFFTFMLI